MLWEKAARRINLQEQAEGKQLLKEAVNWRGIELPQNPNEAAQFIWWCLTQGIFSQMMKCQVKPHPSDRHQHELAPDGVKKILQRIVDFLHEAP